MKLTLRADYAFEKVAIRGLMPAVFDVYILHMKNTTEKVKNGVPGAKQELMATTNVAPRDTAVLATRTTID